MRTILAAALVMVSWAAMAGGITQLYKTDSGTCPQPVNFTGTVMFDGVPAADLATDTGVAQAIAAALTQYVTSSALSSALSSKADGEVMSAHIADTSNPHDVKKSQVGLGDVDNTSDAAKPISTAAQTALNLKADADSLNHLDASKLTAGTVDPARLPASGVMAGTYGGTSSVPVPTIDAAGRVTSITTVAVQGGHGIKSNGASMTARANLNFGSGVTLTDNPDSNATDITVAPSGGATTDASALTSGTLDSARLPESGVTAGTYSSADITVNSKGVVTAASSGAGGGPVTDTSIREALGYTPASTISVASKLDASELPTTSSFTIDKQVLGARHIAAYPASVSNLVARWKLESDTAESASNTACANTGVTFVSDSKFGTAASFDGSSYVSFAPDANIFPDANEPFTLCGWVKSSANNCLFSYGNRSDGNVWFSTSSLSVYGTNATYNTYSTGVWAHYAAVFENGVYTLYKNGEYFTSTTQGNNVALGTCYLGSDGSSNRINGLMRDWRLYRGTKTAAAIADIYAAAGTDVETDNHWELMDALQPDNNLSDLTDTADARSSLGLGTAATTAATDYATAAQGSLASTALQPASIETDSTCPDSDSKIPSVTAMKGYVAANAGSGSAGGAWTLVESWQPTTASASHTFSGLNGNNDCRYLVNMIAVSGSATACDYIFQPNGDTTAGNYSGVRILGTYGSTAGTDNYTAGGLIAGGTATTGGVAVSELQLWATSGVKRRWQGMASRESSGGVLNELTPLAMRWSNTADNITSLVASSQTNGFGVGSRIDLYKRVQTTSGSSSGGMWTLVERWEPSEAANSHTFSGLNGDSDRRYMIVSNVVANGATGQYFARLNNDAAGNYSARAFDGYGASTFENDRQTWTGICIGYTGDAACTADSAQIWARSGQPRLCQIDSLRATVNLAQEIGRFGVVWTNTADNITYMSVNAPAGGNFGVGSCVELWKLAQ